MIQNIEKSDIKQTEKLLGVISAKTIQETYDQYGFVLPNMYQSTFSKKADEHGLKISTNEEQIHILRLLEKLYKEEKKNQKSFQALMNFTINAQNAIKNEDKNELAKIEKSTKEFLERISTQEQLNIQDEVTGCLNKHGFMKYCLTKEGLFFFDGALFVFNLEHYEKMEKELSENALNQIKRLFCEHVIKKVTSNISREDVYVSRFERDKFVIAIKLDIMPYFSLQLNKIQRKPLKLKIRNDKTLSLKFNYSKSMFAKFGNGFRSVLLNAEKKLNHPKNKEEVK